MRAALLVVFSGRTSASLFVVRCDVDVRDVLAVDTGGEEEVKECNAAGCEKEEILADIGVGGGAEG
jgi:hypothetical protein